MSDYGKGYIKFYLHSPHQCQFYETHQKQTGNTEHKFDSEPWVLER
jgi:hypothetical protein